MKSKLLISGVTLGACVLAVSVIMSGAPSAIVSPAPESDLTIVDMAASAPSESDSQASTNTDQIIVAFTAAPGNLARAATAAIAPLVADQLGARVVSVNPITKRSAAVNLDITLSRSQANRIAQAAEEAPGVDYAEPSVNFYPTGSTSSARWNLSQVKLDTMDTTNNTALKPIVVGVIDTGVADNRDLPKALLVNSLDGVIWGKSVSGTAWSESTVKVSYTDTADSSREAEVKPDNDGTWSYDMTDHSAKNDTSLTVRLVDASNNVGDPVTLTVDAAVSLTVDSPINSYTVTGTTDAGAKVVIRDGEESVCETKADTDGHFTCALDEELGDGSYTVTATDPLGNVSDPAELVIDHQAPGTPTIDPNPSDGRSIVVVEVAAGETPSLRSTSSDPVPAGEWSDSDGTWTFTPESRLDENPHLEVILTDEAGNMSEPATVEVDTTAPQLSVVSPSTGEALSGTTEAGATVTVTYPDDSTQQITAENDGEWSLTPDASLSDGQRVAVFATDAVGNTSDSLTITIDQQAPNLTVVSPSTGETLSGTAEAAARVTLRYPDGSTQKTTADSEGDWSVEPSAALKDGDTVLVTATDAAGNVSAELTVNIDRRAPELHVSTTDGTTVSGTSETDAAITITYTDVNQTTHTVHTTVGEGGTWTKTLDPVAADRSTVEVTAADALGNESKVITRTVHYGPPSAPVVDASDGNTVVVRGISIGDVPSLVDRAGDPLELEGTANSDGSWTFTPAERLAESDELYAVATDDAGGRSDLSARIVIDTTAPVIDAAEVVATSELLSGPADSDLSSLTISYQDTDGNEHISTATVEASGWSATLEPAAQAGSQATLTAADAVGNESTSTVDIPAAIASPLPSPTASDEAVTPNSESTSVPAETTALTPESEPPASVAETSQTGTVLPGYDFYSDDADATDDAGEVNLYHGTHVAGIIASEPNSSVGTQGVANGVKILPIKVFGLSSAGTRGAASLDKIAEAIRWGAGLDTAGVDRKNPYPADVLNLSLGANTSSNSCPVTLQSAITAAKNAGTLVVVSAGNDNRSIAQQTPANCKDVLVVTATTSTGGRASYSNWGTSATSSSWLVAAPGGSGSTADCGDITACYGQIFSTFGGNQYAGMYGTSQAAPHVAGVAARMLAVDSALKPADLANIIRGTSASLADGCPTGTCGSGIVNAQAAVNAASQFTTNSGSATPVVAPPARYPQVTARISGTLRTGYTQTASTSTSYASGGLRYQWYRNGSAISGGQSRTYTLTPSDYGKRLTFTVTNNFGARASATTGTVARGYISSLAKPKIRGTRKVGKKLRAIKGKWSVPTTVYRYKWYRNGKRIKGATSRKYKLTWRDRRKRITVRVYVKSDGYYKKSRVSGKTRKIR